MLAPGAVLTSPVSQSLAVMIQRQIPGDAKQPRAHVLGRRGNWGPAYSQEDVLRQIACRLGAADRPAEIPEEAFTVRIEQPFGVGHAFCSHP